MPEYVESSLLPPDGSDDDIRKVCQSELSSVSVYLCAFEHYNLFIYLIWGSLQLPDPILVPTEYEAKYSTPTTDAKVFL